VVSDSMIRFLKNRNSELTLMLNIVYTFNLKFFAECLLEELLWQDLSAYWTFTAVRTSYERYTPPERCRDLTFFN